MVDPLPPEEADPVDSDWHNGNGEAPDRHAVNALALAHQAVAKFPELKKRYSKFIGTITVVTPVIIALAGLAVNRRLHRGESPEHILENITPDEIESMAKEKPAKRKPSHNGGRFSH